MDQSIKLFVILGTQKFPFTRLIKAVENLVITEVFNRNEVLVQSNFTEYKSDIIDIVTIIPLAEFDFILKNADIIITHAGVNSIITCMNYNKKFIVVPRLKKYGEHVDNHQTEISYVMKEKYDVLVLDDLDRLPDALCECRNHSCKKWYQNSDMLISSIKEFINS